MTLSLAWDTPTSHLVAVDSLCSGTAVLNKNIRQELKLTIEKFIIVQDRFLLINVDIAGQWINGNCFIFVDGFKKYFESITQKLTYDETLEITKKLVEQASHIPGLDFRGHSISFLLVGYNDNNPRLVEVKAVEPGKLQNHIVSSKGLVHAGSGSKYLANELKHLCGKTDIKGKMTTAKMRKARRKQICSIFANVYALEKRKRECERTIGPPTKIFEVGSSVKQHR